MTDAHKDAIIAEKRARFPPAETIREYTLITPYAAVDHKNRSLHDYQCVTCKVIVRTRQSTLLNRITHHCIPRTPKPKVLKPKVRRERQWNKARSDNRTGHVGITFDKASHKYRARLKIGTKLIAIGYYKHIQDAIDARAHYVQTHNIPNRLGSIHS